MKLTFNSPFSLIYTLLSVAVFFIFIANGSHTEFFTLNGTVQPEKIEWYAGIIGYAFGHANFPHLLGNFTTLLLIGPLVEHHYGTKKLILISLITIIVTAVIHILFWDHRLLGASGVVFMLIILSSLIPSKGKEIPLTFILIVLLFLGEEIYEAFKPSNVSRFAHITGGLLGAVFGFYLNAKK
jgi:GlpG protein